MTDKPESPHMLQCPKCGDDEVREVVFHAFSARVRDEAVRIVYDTFELVPCGHVFDALDDHDDGGEYDGMFIASGSFSFKISRA